MKMISAAVQVLLCAIVVLAVALAPKPGQHVAVIVGPGSAEPVAIGTIAAAGGWLVDGTGRPWIAIAQSDHPRFVSDLYAAGAWLVVDAEFYFGCTNKNINSAAQSKT